MTTSSGCDWRATSDSGFLSVSPSSGTGSGTVTVRVNANTRTRSRTGTIRIAGETFRVKQERKTIVASQELGRRDAVIIQNTLNLGLNIRSGVGTDHPKIGRVFDGATGTITDGPRTADGYKWWEVDWDNNAPTGWSVEAIDEDLLILRRPPDLAIKSFRVSESTLNPGEEFTLSLTVRNDGYNSSEPANLLYYYSSTSEFTASDVVGVVGTDSVDSLDPGDSSNEQISSKAPLTPGTYYYGVFLDGTQYIDDNNHLNDDSPLNNFAAEKRVKVRKPTFPDLVVESPRVNEDTLAPGESFKLYATVRNEGAGQSRSTRLRYYRSSDSIISTDDTQVETDGVNSLDPDKTDDESATLTAPSKPGIYYYGVCVDNVRGESNTGNNCSDGVRVTVKSPDLVVENVRVSTHILTAGASFTLSATVRNRNTDSSDRTTLRYYRSSDSTISADDTAVGTDSVGSISVNDVDDKSTTLTAPSEPGIYYYGVCVDSVRGESNTRNNCSRGIPVAVRTSVKQAPEIIGTIPTQTLTVGGSTSNVDVSSSFRDPDNDALTYTATSDNTGVATVNMSGALVTISPQNVGSAIVTVTASDGTLTATQHIVLTVEAAPRTVQTLAKISGDNQQGSPGATLLSPLIVEVRDAANRGLQGIDVTFAIIAGGGSLSTQTATTDANGQGSTMLTLGPNAGTNTVEASVTGISAVARFTATAQAPSNQAPEPVGTILTQTLTVGGSDASVNVSSNFRDPDNDSLTYTATLDNTGVATVSVSDALVTITPKSPGIATVTVTASDGTLTATQHIVLTVEAAPRTVQTLAKISGDNQQGSPGATLLSPLIVEVRDAANRGLQGIDVTFAIIAGGGSLSTQTATTDANGQGSTMLTLGPNAGTNTVEASVTGISAVARFTATAQAPSEVVNIPDPNLRANTVAQDYTQWRLPEGAKVRLGKGSISEIAFSPDGARLAVAGSIGIWIYDTATGQEVALLTGHTSYVTSVSFSPDGRTLASGSHDGTVRLWDAATGAELRRLEGHTSYVTSVSFSPDGRTLASGRDDNTVRLWDAATGAELRRLEGHTSFVTSVSFSPDGRTLASGSGDGTVRLWDAATGAELRRLEGHADYVTSVSFSPDGRTRQRER